MIDVASSQSATMFAESLARVERVDAWRRYARSLRRLDSIGYELVEPEAWARLQADLVLVEVRRRERRLG